MQNFEYSDGSVESTGQKTTDAMVQMNLDFIVVRVCQKAYVDAQQIVQFGSDKYRVRSFQTIVL